ncbi:MAG: transposase [Clostridia bacterium]|nr:transposase [Clostridia bacterium]
MNADHPSGPLPQRKKNRWPQHDYAGCSRYFVTICVQPQRNVFWANVGADSIRPLPAPDLTPEGKTVLTAIRAIVAHYDPVEVDHFCIMPDHVHLILRFSADADGRMLSAPTLSTVVGSMKRWVSRQIGRSLWQKSFYDRVLRTEEEYQSALRYIDGNPAQWQADHGDDSLLFDDEFPARVPPACKPKL